MLVSAPFTQVGMMCHTTQPTVTALTLQICPGYGFLSENAEFADACKANDIIFVGPTVGNLRTFGDKTSARAQAIKCGVPVIEGSDGPVQDAAAAKAFTDRVGFPVIIKAAHGGGGRGMRVVTQDSDIEAAFDLATREAEAAFGDGTVFIEQYLDRPRHIEIQILGDGKGNVVHLHERDCSVQRRHQKVVELAPSMGLSDQLKQVMYKDAINITADANYLNAGTVEFLVDQQGRHFFIEVNPRVQVEHTVTEEVTGIDIVKTQFRIAAGASLSDLGLSQDTISAHGFAMQCRITTEDATKDFAPDTGTIMVYRSPGGKGVRLDGGPGYGGASIQPYYDSLLTKITVKGRDLNQAVSIMKRSLSEFRIRGVTTNIPFLQNVMSHPDLLDGTVTTSFIGDNPHLLIPRNDQNRAQRIMQYLGDLSVNGHPDPGVTPVQHRLPEPPAVPVIERSQQQTGLRNLKHVLNEHGPEGFAKAVRQNEGLLLTDTTWRDAHQSLLATRCRTIDMLNIAPATSVALDRAFSIECWGGATFDVAMRFLMECPWDRLEQLREEVPNVPFQMLLRGANAVGYTSYSDNVVHKFCEQSVKSGMDVFRVFDSLNYVENLRLGIDAVGGAGGVVEAGLCCTPRPATCMPQPPSTHMIPPTWCSGSASCTGSRFWRSLEDFDWQTV
jgi:pyruvate carboxylase